MFIADLYSFIFLFFLNLTEMNCIDLNLITIHFNHCFIIYYKLFSKEKFLQKMTKGLGLIVSNGLQAANFYHHDYFEQRTLTHSGYSPLFSENILVSNSIHAYYRMHIIQQFFSPETWKAK